MVKLSKSKINELKKRADVLEITAKELEKEIKGIKAKEKILTKKEQKNLEKMKIKAEKLGYRLERDFETTLLYKERELQTTKLILHGTQNQLNAL